MTRFEVRPLTDETRKDFYRIHCQENETGWCHCIAWWVPTWDGWDKRTPEGNRKLRNELFDAGHLDGYILYADDKPVAWCQFGQRDRLEKLRTQYKLDPSPETWAVSCFVVAPAWRGQGLAQRLLLEIVADLKRRGVKHVQGFPRSGAKHEAGGVWTGPESIFLRAGFKIEMGLREWPVYGLLL